MTKKISNLIELLQRRVAQQPLQTAYTFLNDGEAEEINLTYEQLERRARAVAARLQAMRAGGERVLLLYPPGLEYISAFWGCLYAGAIAVPAYPPRQNRSLQRLQSVAADAQSTLALTTSALLSKVDAFSSQCAELKDMRWLATETIPDEVAEQWRSPAVGRDDLAFLQYTSGSTSTPKGVMVTHGNLLDNERMIQESFRQTEQSVIVGWLPLYHDMGLIGNVLQPVFVGARCVLMSPVSFLQNPFRWLSAISRYRATTSGGPNFAYDLCVRKIGDAERQLLDLSSWEVAFNGAEPVRAATLEAFAEAFAPCGFRMEAFRPCYGLAEATLLVSSEAATHGSPLVKTVETEALQNNLAHEVDEDSAGARTLVSCGRPPTGQEVYIYHPETLTECLPGEVGEICVSGANVTKGYWNRPEETARTFQTHLSAGRSEPLLRTGDLGVMLDGSLFVTGRLKDLIIVRGRNHYPHDIERTVERSHPALRPGGGAAFTVEIGGEERLVVAQEVNVRRQLETEEIVRAIGEAVAEEHELQVHAVTLLKTGSIPKTSSGKIQRRACREMFLSKTLDAVSRWELSTPSAQGEGEASGAEPDAHNVESVEAWLRAEVAAQLGVRRDDIDVNRPISDYALDSLAAIELTHRIEAQLGVVLPMVSLLKSPSIAEVAAQTQLAAADAKATDIDVQTHASRPSHALSSGQQALWFLYQLAPENSAYNISSAVRVTSVLDVPALRRAFQRLVDRHPSLRSTFGTRSDAPVQHILDYAEVSFQQIDAARLSEEALNSLLVAEAERPFDLVQGPLLRVHLFERAADEHIVLIVIHHIVADFWSLSVLTNELGILYTAEVNGTPAQLTSNRLQYADYVRRQEEMLAGAEGERLWAYWREQLAGELPSLNLPTDYTRPPIQTYRGDSEAFKLDEEVTRGLKDLSRAHGATLYMTLLAAFQTLLYRYTGQEDLLVGSPTAGRNQNGLAGVIGYFINPLVLRGRPSGASTFASFLEQTRQTVLSAFEHQDYPFPLLVERLQPERNFSRSPLFQVMFILQKAHLLNEEGLTAFALGEAGAQVKLGALELESMALEQRVSQFDLTLAIVESGDTLSASLQYNTELFDPSTIRRMAEHLQTLLRGVVSQPQGRLSELPLLTEGERRQLLVEWNRTPQVETRELCLHQLFEEQARRTPHATALVTDTERVTYAQLDARANRLAHHLRSLGAAPEQFVALLLERDVEMVVSLLAVLKTGAAYLPLEPTYPHERLRFMLAETGAGLLVTQERLVALADELLSDNPLPPQVLCLERERQALLSQPEDAPETPVVSANMAYVIFTSGSTGRPKGVVINHSSAVVMARWAASTFTPAQLSGVLASTSICFDLSVFELFAPLSVGGTVILAADALALPHLAASSEVTLVNTVPSAMAELVRDNLLPENVRTVNLAGEALSRELVEQLYATGTVSEVFNLYGPSEDTTYSTYALIEGGGESAPVIGRPLSLTQAYVLDACGEPVAVGVTGELYLGGQGLARGYWRRPELTAERFVPDPFGEAGGRLYRTGDVVKWNERGELEYLGRVDQQVKVRGYRIELGEVEAVLRRGAGVQEAAVVVSGEGGEKRLVAFLVLEGEAKDVEGSQAIRELREWMRERVPVYMVPQTIVLIEEMPLTANGKVDRRQLTERAAAEGRGAQREVREAQTGTQAGVLELWREVLGIERVSVEDNFFEVGGHSLLATRLMSQVRRRFGVEIELRRFFERPSVEGLAHLVELAGKSAQVSNVPPIEAAPRVGKVPLSFAQQRLWFIHQLEADNTAYNMPAAARLTGDLDISALERSLTEIVRRHEVLRTVFVLEEDEPTQIILPAQTVRVPVVDLSALAADEREAEAMRLATAEAQKAFDLSRGPLIRFTLLRLGADDHMLLLTMHHIVFDGWSIGVLIGELTKLYRAYHSGEDSPLAELPLQYADYATWQRGWLQGEALEEQLAYWRQQLAHAPESLNLPTDKPRPALPGSGGASRQFQLSTSLVTSLKALGHEEGSTLFMVLLAALQVLLSRYTGQTDLTVGAAVSNRNRAEVEGLIGFFVNMLVMRGDLGNDPNFREYLRSVRKVALEAYAHQDVPFETLVESLKVGRSLNRTPLFQVALVLNNAPTMELELAGVKLKRIEVEAGRAQFDLSFSLSETEDGSLTGSINYNTDLFYASTIERMHEHFRTLLDGIVARPEARLSELPLLTAGERRQILSDWNQTAVEWGTQDSLAQLFEAQVRRTPEAIALSCEGVALSYAELNERANRLAHRLRKEGVGAEVLVGVLMERSVEMVVALLGIVKAGGAYVPLDPEYPQQRLTLMMEEAAMPVLLTQRHLRELITLEPGRKPESERERETVVLVLDDEAEVERLAQEPLADPASVVSGENLAYCIYTSGSTGKPKGAMNTHEGIVNRLLWMQETYQLDASDAVLQKTTFSFDVSVWEFFWPLLTGARLVMARPGGHRDSAYLAQVIEEEGITTLHFVPSMLQVFLGEESIERCHSLKRVVCSGEALSWELQQRFFGRLPEVELHNLYGPTEAAVDVTWWACERESERTVVPIGKAIANTEIYILDEALRPVPVGVAGELYIGGVQLARGYVGRPELTAERFVPHPESVEGGARLYRTGDLVRWSEQGDVEYLGRMDQQVKVRGFRIELGEVEAVLQRAEGVRESVVVVSGEGAEKRLVAFLVPEDAEGVETPERTSEERTREVREWMREQVPAYMVPQTFVLLEELPLTANGKVDRRELTARAGEQQRGGKREVVEARTETESAVMELWREVLGVERVSVNDNFFEVGGHSLLATRLMSQVRRKFGVEIELRHFFERSSVEDLAQMIELAQQARAKSTPPAIIRASREHYRMSTSRKGAPTLPEALRKEAAHK